jgi:hypothetical protein
MAADGEKRTGWFAVGDKYSYMGPSLPPSKPVAKPPVDVPLKNMAASTKLGTCGP